MRTGSSGMEAESGFAVSVGLFFDGALWTVKALRLRSSFPRFEKRRR